MALPQVTGLRLLRALKRAGWQEQRGGSTSHRKLRHPDKPGRVVVVAVHGGKTIPMGTLRGILEDAEMTVAELREVL